MFLEVVLFALAIVTLASSALAYIGPNMPDRLLGVSLISTKLIMMIVIYALLVGESFYLDIALISSLLGFIGIVFICNFIIKKGKI